MKTSCHLIFGESIHRQTLSCLWSQQCSTNSWIFSNFWSVLFVKPDWFQRFTGILHPLKTSENLRILEIFRGYRIPVNLWNQSIWTKFTDQKVVEMQWFSTVNFSVKISYSWKPLTIFTKSSILDIRQGSEYIAAQEIVHHETDYVSNRTYSPNYDTVAFST